MSNHKLKKFCKLTRYIQQIDKDLHAVIDDLCIEHHFKPERDAGGITFLYPKEKAYRQKIINAAYSTNPEVAVNMIKALIIQGYYEDGSKMSGELVNKLNQKIDVESAGSTVKLSNGLTLTKDSGFTPMGHRENMAVFILSGKGEIPTNGASGKPKKLATTGGCLFSSGKSHLNKFMAEHYSGAEFGSLDNIYTKKVYLHMKMICNDSNHKEKILCYLGNDEFSDSYLLDMFCEKYCNGCFSKLYKCLGSGNYNDISNEVQKIKHEDYLVRKDKIIETCGGKSNNDNQYSEESLFSGISSPMDIRTKVCGFYEKIPDGMNLLGKDLFIVFSNNSKQAWIQRHRYDCGGAIEIFKDYAYLASKVYNDTQALVKQEFDIARDLTLYGNLLKSDVLMYQPQGHAVARTGYKTVTEIPVPTTLEKYSLNALMQTMKKVGGGNDEARSLLQNLL